MTNWDWRQDGVWLTTGSRSRPRSLTPDELSIVQEAAASEADAPADIGEYTWVWRDASYRSPHEVWLNALHPIDRVPLDHRLPYPLPGRTTFGWVPARRMVVYRLLGPQ